MIELGVTGWPLTRTHSPLIHGRFLDACGMEGVYRKYPVPAPELASSLTRLHLLGLRGLNVTFPHKAAVVEMCCDMDQEAADVGAVNTLLSVDGGWKGFNTDVGGFRRCFTDIDAPDPVFVVGAGGAAMAVAKALSLDSRNFTVFSANPVMWSGDGHAKPLGELNSCLDVSAGTVVNATTLGWNDGDSFPLAKALPGRFHFFDLNYNPGWHWRNMLRDRGIRVATGECMLARQAAESFRIWTGTEVGDEVVAGVMAELLSPDAEG